MIFPLCNDRVNGDKIGVCALMHYLKEAKMASLGILLVFVLSIGNVSALGRCCPNGWVTFEESCYLFADETSVDWIEATHFCSAHTHAHLVTVESSVENQFLTTQCKKLFKTDTRAVFWLGATDDEVEGLWVWYTSKQRLSDTYSNWQTNEPDDVGTQDCAVMFGPYGYNWGSIYCSYSAHPICEMNSTYADWQEIVG